ncbi:MAG: hypothetical protein K2J80_08645 [Oscillospiraceae bacterium]|nr:hypothetical protein [Oscillospiraceae bacterium]
MTFAELDTELGRMPHSGYAPFMLSLSEGADNELTVRIASSYAGDPHETVEDEEPNPALRRLLNKSRPLLPDEKRVYDITFEDYIIYQVGNESYCSGDPNERFSGKFLRICEKSALLRRLGEFSDAQTLADGTYYPGKWTHYEIVTQNHIIDVVSAHEPVVNIKIGT